MLEAGYQGLVDFARLDWQSPRERWRVYLWLEFLQQRRLCQMLIHDHAQHCAALSVDYDHHWQQLLLVRQQMLETLRLQPVVQQSAPSNLEQDLAAYTRYFGDPRSREYQQQMQALLQHWKSQRCAPDSVANRRKP